MAAIVGIVGLAPCVKAQSAIDGLVGSIFSGVPVAGALDTGDILLGDGTYFESWEIELAVPSFLDVTLASPDFDTFLAVVLPDDTIMDLNDDCIDGVTTNSCIQDLPAISGTYYVVVNSFGAGEVGNYDLSMNATPVPEPVTGWLVASSALVLLRRRR